MPVPVPLYYKPSAHPVNKPDHPGESDYLQYSVFQHLTSSLPAPPTGPPPSFASREEWINSLPDWRRNKPRRVWEEDSNIRFQRDISRSGFREGLTVAGNAAVIKGAPAQACIPPISTLIASADFAAPPPTMSMFDPPEEDTDDEMSSVEDCIGWQSDSDTSRMNDSLDEDVNFNQLSDDDDSMEFQEYRGSRVSNQFINQGAIYAQRSFERGVFSPGNDISPDLGHGNDPSSSPVGPQTPFGDFVDRAVADNHASFAYENSQREVTRTTHHQYGYPDEFCNAQCQQCQLYQHVEQPAQQAIAPEPVMTPTATASYKRLAEPLSEWIATFVWKVCTTGMSLKPEYAQPSASVRHYSVSPPNHLPKSIHSMLLSTLLQPSAIFLALWYIVQLPVYFGPTCLGPANAREIRFRAELLGEAHMALDRDTIEMYAPFRLVLLGSMLANKWLDDHTFSNKTWHTISNVPVHSLNMLESLALDLFSYNLVIPTGEWTRWLTQLLSYHVSLSSPAFPQPISRPSTSPHTIIRKALDSLVSSSAEIEEGNYRDSVPQPIFLGLEEQKKDRFGSHAFVEENIDVLEIDLDEDGPLREEYLPRRRISAAGSMRAPYDRATEVERILPPPAKWSPESDEPITRCQLRAQGQYVAPQPIAHHPLPVQQVATLPPPPFHQALEVSRNIWPVENVVQKQQEPIGRHHFPSVYSTQQPTYVGYEFAYPVSHSRSQSFSFSQPAASQSHGHYRSLSQSRFDGFNDMRVQDSRYTHLPPPPVNGWAHFERPSYSHVY
ncbi:hypothetical protein ABKN59_000550 [Abortiporus biennis]